MGYRDNEDKLRMLWIFVPKSTLLLLMSIQALEQHKLYISDINVLDILVNTAYFYETLKRL